jgi:hypothetical protein
MRINYLHVSATTCVPPTVADKSVEKQVETLSTRLRINQYIEEAAGISILDLLRPPACEKAAVPSCAYESAGIGSYAGRGGNILL